MISILLAAVSLASAAAPSTLQQQGHLTSATGEPISGARDVVVRLYDAEGTEVFTEAHPGVVFTDGHYQLVLGSVEALDPAWEQAVSLGVALGTSAPELSRQPLHRVASPLDRTACTQGEVLRATGEGWGCGAARTYLGTLDVTAGYSGTTSSWTKINSRDSYGFSQGRFNEYVGPDQVRHQRLCAAYTDSGSGSGQVQLRFVKRNTSTVRWSTSFPTTGSGSASVRNHCTAWQEVGALSNCTYSWTNTCQIQVRHNQGRHMQIYDLWWEFSAL